jgi:hypothetical protein
MAFANRASGFGGRRLTVAKPPYYVSRVPVLSSSHVSAETMDQMQSGPAENSFGTVAAYPEGVFLYLQTVLIPEGLPEDLLALCKWARKRRCNWIRLDADGDLVDGLPKFDW